MTLEQFKYEVLPLKDKLYRYALSRVYDVELAKDVTQDVLLKLWEQKDRLNNIKNIEAWAIRCTRNLSIDIHRSTRKKTGEIEEAAHLSSEAHLDQVLENDDLIQSIKQILESLPDKQKEIFRLKDLLGYSNAEIQEILFMNENQVKVYLFRARKKIKRSLLKMIQYGLDA